MVGRFWNNLAYAFRNTRAAFAAMGMLAVLGVLLYSDWFGPGVASREVIRAPVIEVERETEDTAWIRVVVDTPTDGPVRFLWQELRSPMEVGREVELVVTERDDGSRDYRLLDRP